MQIIPQINYKSVLAPIKSIKKRNEAFHQLDDQSKRLEIAWDALQLIVNGFIAEYSSSYWDGVIYNLEQKSTTAEELQKNLLKDKNLTDCWVCQRGLLMLSTIRVGNKITPGTNDIACGVSNILQGFSMESMELQESYYENYSDAKFLSQHPYQYKTLQMKANILCNILVNGDFKEDDFKNYLLVIN